MNVSENSLSLFGRPSNGASQWESGKETISDVIATGKTSTPPVTNASKHSLFAAITSVNFPHPRSSFLRTPVFSGQFLTPPFGGLFTFSGIRPSNESTALTFSPPRRTTTGLIPMFTS
ncbi:hypothetical protein CDAR_197311 [Caerostris darwini]|uniref:Uncharacterized protein n=1 Tax=Caerostris darwini TaxID=1538125 RepID=A0AAV4R6I0_9ARAC|nr:hypothetical protein CDAR_197311 [Caerostris darwini]